MRCYQQKQQKALLKNTAAGTISLLYVHICDVCTKIHTGTYSFVPSLTPEEMQRLEVKRVPQNAGETIEMQVRYIVVLQFCNPHMLSVVDKVSLPETDIPSTFVFVRT